MIKILVGNVKCKIQGAPLSVMGALTNLLSVKVPNYYFSTAYKTGKWDGHIRFLVRPANVFPTGLLPKVMELLCTDMELEVELEDKRPGERFQLETVPDDFCISEEKQARAYQVETINKVMSNKIQDVPFTRGIIHIATNGGKTVIAEGILKQLYSQLLEKNGYFLFVTHSKEIARQARKSIQQDLRIPVGFIGDGQWDVKPVTIAIVTTLYRRMKDNKDEWLELKNKVLGFIADETHHASSDSWYSVFSELPNASIRLGLTGTIDESKPVQEMKLYACTGSVINKVSNDFLIQHGYSAKPRCILFKVTSPELGDMDYIDAYQYGIVENRERNQYIYDICEKETSAGNKVLILVEHLEHGDEIEEALKPLNQHYNRQVYFTNGQLSSDLREELLDKMRGGQLDVLISSNILDEGIDISGINAVIYARGMKSMRKILQGIGRGLRLKKDNNVLRFYDFIDDTHMTLLRHSMDRYKTLKSEKFDATLLLIQDYKTMSWDKINGKE